MKKIAACIFLGLTFVSSAFAGTPAPLGFSTLQINWSGSGTTAVPTMSTYALLLLAVLLALIVFKLARGQSSLIRAVAPLAAFGVAAAFAVMTENPVAGGVAPPTIGGASCSGSETYTVNASTPPPCFVNTCGSPVTVSYTFIDGATSEFPPTPITTASCTLAYYCEEVGGASDIAAEGATIPSDGRPYATAFCEEIFGSNPT